MLPRIRELAMKGITVKCSAYVEEENSIGFVDKYETFPSQTTMTCYDSNGKELSSETSFNVTIFETWILSDRCRPKRCKYGSAEVIELGILAKY